MYSNIALTKIDGSSINFSSYSNKVLLIINVASFCAHTWQYNIFQDFYKKNKHFGFEILAFPCNQFGEQEPEDDASIAKFCKANFSVTFDLFSKVNVSGENQCELYKFLTSSNPMQVEDTNVKWNFTKYLVDRDGSVLARFQPPEFPVNLITKIIRG
jgi:glutathione peroxidase